MRLTRMRAAVAGALAVLVGTAQPAWADAETDKLRVEIEQLKREMRELRSVLERQKQDTATKAEVQAVRGEVSEVKATAERPGLLSGNALAHFSGYADVGYASRKRGPRSFNLVSFNPIFHFQYKENLFFEGELETQLLPDGSADMALEYGTLNYFLNDYVTVFGGKFLSPIGFFRQNLHPSWINKFASTPPGFGHDGAAPSSDVGAGVRGGFHLGSMKANYALYVGNGARLELNAAGDEIEAIEAEGSVSNPSRSLMVGGRLGLHPWPNLQLGISAGGSKVAVETAAGVEPRRSYRVGGADFAYQLRGLDLRGEYVRQRVGDLETSVAPAGGRWSARYLQAAYRFPGTGWEPVLRWGRFVSPHQDQKQKQFGVGLNYWAAASAVLKLGFERNRGLAGTANNENRLLLQFAHGF